MRYAHHSSSKESDSQLFWIATLIALCHFIRVLEIIKRCKNVIFKNKSRTEPPEKM